MRKKGRHLPTAGNHQFQWLTEGNFLSHHAGRTSNYGALALRRILSSLCCATITSLLWTAPANAESSTEDDLTKFSLEQLINMKVYSASKFEQKVSEAPAAVTLITAADIKTYGYRKLSDILRSVRSIHGRYDRNYDFVGVRGFGRPGDYQSRLLVLIDGYRLNDALYDAAAIGTDFILDVDLIDRVEFVPGPGSSIYGNNAFFGVVNVITRPIDASKGLEASVETASYNTNKARMTYSNHLENGLGILMSGSIYDSQGRNLYFKEFDTPTMNGGVANQLDYDHYRSFFTKLSYDAFTLTAAYSNRSKGTPIISLDAPFNDSHGYTVDKQAFIDLQYYKSYTEKLNVMARIFYGKYSYDGNYPFFENHVMPFVGYERSRPTWAGTEIKFIDTKFDKHKLVYGVEYVDNIHQDVSNSDDIAGLTYEGLNRSRRYGIYIQDEFSFRDNWTLNAGIRYDKSYNDAQKVANPRLGLIYKPDTSSAIKLLYGTAFRSPNVYELYYHATADKANPNLKPEKIKTYDLVFEKYYDTQLRLTAGAFYYQTRDLIDSYTDPADNKNVYDNLETVDA